MLFLLNMRRVRGALLQLRRQREWLGCCGRNGSGVYVSPMKTNLRSIAILVVMFACAHRPAEAAACVDVKDCSEWIVHGGGPARSLVYRTYALDRPNPAIVRAFVMVHGAGRDADNYFRTAVAAAFLAGALDDTVVISPRFASAERGCQDMLAANEVSWPCTGDSWRSGGAAPKNST